MKRNEDNDNLLSQTTYWNMKLDMKHMTEKMRYKKLCGYKLTKIDKEYLDGAYYITFSDWKEYMERKISVLNKVELLEYSKYLNLNLERQKVFEGLVASFMFPFVIAMLSPILGEVTAEFVNSKGDTWVYNFSSYLVKLIFCIIALFIVIKRVIDDLKENKANYLFYRDMYEIVMEKLQE